jgi:uncharacterized protein (DUF305 family)
VAVPGGTFAPVLPTTEESPPGVAAAGPEAPSRWARVVPAVVTVVALCALSGAIGFGVGAGRPPGRGSVDVGFLLDMSVHHEQGAALANLELINGTTEDVQVFAREILRDQSYEIGLMQFQLGDWGYAREEAGPEAMGWMGTSVPLAEMPGMATRPQLDLLRAARGRDADALFLQLMAAHHRGAIHMASYAVDHAQDDDVRRLAARIVHNQTMEIEELRFTAGRTGLG